MCFLSQKCQTQKWNHPDCHNYQWPIHQPVYPLIPNPPLALGSLHACVAVGLNYNEKVISVRAVCQWAGWSGCGCSGSGSGSGLQAAQRRDGKHRSSFFSPLIHRKNPESRPFCGATCGLCSDTAGTEARKGTVSCTLCGDVLSYMTWGSEGVFS